MAADLAADLVIRNARGYTLDPARPWAGAVACRGGQIAWAGPDEGGSDETAADWAAAARRGGGEVIDAGGALVLPGFIDSHNHVRLGADADCVQLTGAGSLAEARARVRAWLATRPDADWVEGEGLDYPALRPGPGSLDDVAGGRPVFLFEYSGHSVWVNHAARQRLGIGAGTERMPFGVVERDARGEPTGLLTEFATTGLAGAGHQALAAVLPWGSPERRYRRLCASLDMAIRCGITTLTEPQSGLDDLPLYERARAGGRLRGRLIAALFHPPGASRDLLGDFDAARRQYAGDRLRAGPVKLYIDDVIEQHGAALFGPYADAPDTSGGTFYDPAEFADLVRELDARAFQVLIHAVGDRGVHVALDAFEHARRVNGGRDSRHQIVHIELLADADVHRFAELGVVACMQPRHCAADVGGPEWRAAAGPARWPRAWPVASLQQAGAALAFSSDWNVAEMDPLLGIYTALTRRDLDGGEPFVPGQAIGLPAALAAYTAGGAYASFRDHDLGRIAPGRAADLIAVSPDPFTIEPEQIRDCHVDLTVAAGQVVHRAC